MAEPEEAHKCAGFAFLRFAQDDKISIIVGLTRNRIIRKADKRQAHFIYNYFSKIATKFVLIPALPLCIFASNCYQSKPFLNRKGFIFVITVQNVYKSCFFRDLQINKYFLSYLSNPTLRILLI